MSRRLILTVVLLLTLPAVAWAQCGDVSEACCPGDTCNDPATLLCQNGTCVECGHDSQVCCAVPGGGLK
jgi:hypothetical protein